ncbi:MAG TPA: nucleoside-diphosphate sugar epimerase [Bacteroidales bacterium]|jgi:FlaA1/EpsC-like NDP-sugar epimerase|nr:nucleoside-diphosphate sugar epimerase [Bacteroidales bacterium]
MINTEQFISSHITFRKESFFEQDLANAGDELHRAIKNKSVLVIGGGGTIGSSFILEVLRFNPAKLFVVDLSENYLTELTRDLRSTYGLTVPADYKTYPINFDDPIFYRILADAGPFDIVANFAAHKHVRSEKDHFSVTALLQNNIIKAVKLLETLAQQPPEHFFCVSTDKAANPVNIMGASKKIMEEVILSYSDRFNITTARFANVAFSNGSLLAGYLERMMKQQPLSCPSDIKRFFVSPKESGQICLLACILGKTGDIFFPRLAETQMMNFKDITLDFIREMGYTPLVCGSEQEARYEATRMHAHPKSYPVFFFESDTSGEKTYEEFYTTDEQLDIDTFTSLGVIKNAVRKPLAEITAMLNELTDVLELQDVTKADIVQVMRRFLPGFHHIETGKNLDQKM